MVYSDMDCAMLAGPIWMVLARPMLGTSQYKDPQVDWNSYSELD